ncbi:MAG: hypothetical protein ACM3ON_12085 [Chloroflexota bacterium]
MKLLWSILFALVTVSFAIVPALADVLSEETFLAGTSFEVAIVKTEEGQIVLERGWDFSDLMPTVYYNGMRGVPLTITTRLETDGTRNSYYIDGSLFHPECDFMEEPCQYHAKVFLGQDDQRASGILKTNFGTLYYFYTTVGTQYSHYISVLLDQRVEIGGISKQPDFVSCGYFESDLKTGKWSATGVRIKDGDWIPFYGIVDAEAPELAPKRVVGIVTRADNLQHLEISETITDQPLRIWHHCGDDYVMVTNGNFNTADWVFIQLTPYAK